MLNHKDEFRIVIMSRVLDVSRSGYYAFKVRQPSVRVTNQRKLDAQIHDLFVAHKQRDGARPICAELKAQGVVCDRKTVNNSLLRQSLRAKAAKRFKATTDSNHNLPVAENVLQQNFVAATPNQKWVSDITYLWTDAGWMYLAIVIDLYSRAVIGWSLQSRMTRQLVCDALQMALWRRHMPKGVIVHSDRGSQYCSQDYQTLLARHELICSMSRKGNCWDNAVAESFFHTLKIEAIYGERFATHEAIKQAIFEYIEVDYNRTRRHSSIGYVSPMMFEVTNVA
jgi:transposase InsO family protein